MRGRCCGDMQTSSGCNRFVAGPVDSLAGVHMNASQNQSADPAVLLLQSPKTKLEEKIFMRSALRTLAAAAMASVLTTFAHAGTLQTVPGNAVFVNANSPEGNKVVVLHRTPSGELKKVATVPTGGKGSGRGERNPPDPLGAQDALVLSQDGRWLFAANPGSNQVTTFRVFDGFLVRTDIVSSGGAYPNSIALNGDDVYVLNAGGETSVVGFRLTEKGNLVRIPGSKRVLATASPQINKQPDIANAPSQLKFSPDGNFLVVTDKNLNVRPGIVQVFKVGLDGLLSAKPVITPSPDATPFGFTFDRNGHLIVTNAFTNSVQSYRINDDGSHATISLVPTNRCVGDACSEPCWIDLSRNFAFTSNTSSDDIASFTIGLDGKLTLLETVAGQTGTKSNPIDITVSGDGRWLHILS